MKALETEVLTDRAFRHEAILYGDEREYVRRLTAFIRGGLAVHEPVFAVLDREKIDLLRTALGDDARAVQFADMAEVGRNPARIIPAWHTFVVENAQPGRGLRGIGEPVYPERSRDELRECDLHESLLNLAFEDTPDFWLVCLYNTQALPKAVIEGARRNHPFVHSEGGPRENADYHAPDGLFFDDPLPEPSTPPMELTFHAERLRELRRTVTEHAEASGLAPQRADDLSLAVSELATNSLRYGGGEGTLAYWQDGDVLIYEVRDSGFLNQPMVGRRRPTPSQTGGFGLWIVNQLCDLVQVGSTPWGTVVRVHMRRI